MQYGLPLAEVVPLFAALLSLPLPADYAPSKPLARAAEAADPPGPADDLAAYCGQQPVLFVVEDLHWVDPSTLELLSLLVDQAPPPASWHCSPFGPTSPALDGSRPPHPGHGPSAAPPPGRGGDPPGSTREDPAPEVTEQIVAKTDGVPLFVEELTKMVLESICSRSTKVVMSDRSSATTGHSRHAA